MRNWLISVVILVAVGAVAASPARPTVTAVSNLQLLAQQSKSRNIPIMMMFSSDDCRYCLIVEEDFLIPMLISGDYTNRVMITKFKIDSNLPVVDFNGGVTTAEAIQSRYKINMTPTILYLDATGHELVEKQVGLTTPDYYGGYLDMSIDEALKKLNAVVD